MMTQCCFCCLLFLLCWKKKPECRSYFNWGPFSFYSLSWRSENSWNNTEDLGRKGLWWPQRSDLFATLAWEKKKEKKGWANYPSSPEERGPPGDLDSFSLVKVESVTPPIKLEFNCWVTFPGVGDSTKGIVGKRCSSNPTCADRVFGVSAGCVLHV